MENKQVDHTLDKVCYWCKKVYTTSREQEREYNPYGRLAMCSQQCVNAYVSHANSLLVCDCENCV